MSKPNQCESVYKCGHPSLSRINPCQKYDSNRTVWHSYLQRKADTDRERDIKLFNTKFADDYYVVWILPIAILSVKNFHQCCNGFSNQVKTQWTCESYMPLMQISGQRTKVPFTLQTNQFFLSLSKANRLHSVNNAQIPVWNISHSFLLSRFQ